MAVVASTSAVLGIVVPWWFERRRGNLDADQQRRWIAGLILAQVAALVAMVVTGSFVVAAAASLAVDRLRSLKAGLLSAWVVPLTPRHQRATVLSTLEQTDSISQVVIGPLLGGVGRAFGIPAALAASAAVLAPSAAVVASTRSRDTVPACPSPAAPSSSSSLNPSPASSTTSAGNGTP